mgnify:FL=1
MIDRNPSSHKGENGKVAIIGGSPTIHGAPLLSALAAEASGGDLIFVCLPSCHKAVAKTTSLNFQVHPFKNDLLKDEDIEPILELLATMDSAVIGPGISKDPSEQKVLDQIIQAASCDLVLDATALQKNTLSLVKGKNAIVTPHLGELERMGIDQDQLSKVASENNATICLKGETDLITHSNGDQTEIDGGSAGLTVGGTGDVLAGLIGGLIILQHASYLLR